MCIYLSDNAIFVLIFIAGLVLGVVAHRYKLELDKAGEDYDKKFNCMGIRKPTPNRPAPPKPLHNPNL